MKSREWYNNLSAKIFKSALEVHKSMGPGLLESIYEHCLLSEFLDKNIIATTQVVYPLKYKNRDLNKNFRIDILVEDSILIEIKAVIQLLPVHEAQIISYLKLTDKRLGFLINFNVDLLKNGFHRYVNNF